MTFLDWLKTMKGKWLSVYTLNVLTDADGMHEINIGKLSLVGADFIELLTAEDRRCGIRVDQICEIYERKDGNQLEEKLLDFRRQRDADALATK